MTLPSYRTPDRPGARPARASARPAIDLAYPGVARPVRLQGAPELEAALASVLKGWVPRRHSPVRPVVTGPAPVSRVERRKDGYRVVSAHLEAPLDGLGLAAATCAVAADLAQSAYEARPGSLALHCGAFTMGGRLIAVTGPARAGKSTLVARLTAEPDVQVFCDDVLPFPDAAGALGLGLAPRLRLPLPAGASPAFRAHVAAHMGPRDSEYAYVLGPNVAPHGTRAPLSVLILLHRRRGTQARLHALPQAEALRHVMLQNMNDLTSADAAVDLLSGLLRGVLCATLVYSDLEEAVALLRRTFADPRAQDPAATLDPPLVMDEPAQGPLAADPGRVWARDPQARLQPLDAGACLWRPGRVTVWHLNPLALAVWTLLEAPDSADGLAPDLAEAFPDVPLDRIRADVAALLDQMGADGLLLDPAEDQAPDAA